MGSKTLIRRWYLIGAMALGVAPVGAGCGPAEEVEDPSSERQIGGLTDAEVAAVAQAINDTQVELGRVALERVDMEVVRRFVQRVVDQHTRAQTELGQLLNELTIQPADHDLVQQVRSEAMRERSRLDLTPRGGLFDRAYIDGQLQLLNSYLRLLNNRLVESATIPEYSQVLERLQDDINDRFNEALQIRDSGAVPH